MLLRSFMHTPACATRHAVILAAGESKRTRPLTAHRPKPLIPLLGRPLLARILDELVGIVDQATLVVGYRAAAIEAHFGAAYRGIALRYVQQTEVNGTAGALQVAGPIDEPFFLLYGDNLIARADVLGVCVQRYSMAALPVADAHAFGVLDIVDDQVRRIIEKPADPPPNALANPGIFHFDAAVFPLLAQIAPSPRGELELTDLIAMLAAAHPVGYHICTGHWVPVGTPWEALTAAHFLLAQHESAVIVDPTAAVDPTATLVGPVWIGPACVVAAGAHVEGSALEGGAKVAAGAQVRASVLGAGAAVDAGACVAASWLDDGAYVGAEAQLLARPFAEIQPTAAVLNQLDPAALITRGAILAQDAQVAPGTIIPPGTVIG
jgi:bifunctional UDP-N-acetylglucosamine pyrophosphorylase/glucosamine-1-phosphate N-acetyltransferase